MDGARRTRSWFCFARPWLEPATAGCFVDESPEYGQRNEGSVLAPHPFASHLPSLADDVVPHTNFSLAVVQSRELQDENFTMDRVLERSDFVDDGERDDLTVWRHYALSAFSNSAWK
jgi:hypothetical protein